MRDGRTGVEASGRLWVCTGQGDFIPSLTIAQQVLVSAECSAHIKAKASEQKEVPLEALGIPVWSGDEGFHETGRQRRGGNEVSI